MYPRSLRTVLLRTSLNSKDGLLKMTNGFLQTP